MKKNELNIQSIMMKKINNEKINWINISSLLYKANIDFIDEFHNEIYWPYVFTKPLKEEILLHIINKYVNDRDNDSWGNISMYQKLSTQFMELYYTKLQSAFLVKYQKLEEGFILKHYEDFEPISLLMFQELSNNIIELIEKEIPNAQSIIEYKKMCNNILTLIDNTKNNVKKIGLNACYNLEESQRNVIRKLKTVLRKMN